MGPVTLTASVGIDIMSEEEKHERFLLPLFDGTNFTAWKYRMRVLLEEHELVECVEAEAVNLPDLQDAAGDSNEVKKAKQVKREKRAKKDKRCKSILVSRIHDSQLEYVQEKTTPKAIWDALVRVFERKSIASRMHLKRQMLSLRLESGNLQDHFLRFDRLVREYRGTGAVIEEIDVICHLLLTLGPAYSTVVTALETMPEENLTLEFVKCRLLDEEIKQRGGGSVEFYSSKTESAAFVGAKKNEQKKKKKQLRCFGCQEEGHKVSDCPRSQHQQKKNVKVWKQSKANLADDGAVVFVSATDCVDCVDRHTVQWFVDSGCTDHMAKDRELFDKLVPLETPVEIAVAKNGQSIIAHHSGTVRLQSVVNGKCIPCTVTNVLYVPALRFNLFSVLNVEKKGMRVVFDNGRVSIHNGSKVVATGTRRGKLYELDLIKNEDCKSASVLACGRVTKELELWHRRFGHLNLKQLEQLVSRDMVDGMRPVTKSSDKSVVICEPCIVGKQTRKPFPPRGGKRSSRVLEVIHSDVCGPVTPIGRNGERFFVTFIDDWSHFLMIFPMKRKDEVYELFVHYEALVTAKFGTRISRFVCDNGGEYKNRAFQSFCRKKGIEIQWTVPYTPELNGTSERMNRTVIERARAMLEGAKLDKSFWVQAVCTAAYVINRSPTCAIDPNKTPSELWEGKRPDVSRLRSFGCAVYVHVPQERRKKLDPKAWKGIFVGYAAKGYLLWNPNENSVVVARDVDFLEQQTFEEENAKKEGGVSVIRVGGLENDTENERNDDNQSASGASNANDSVNEDRSDDGDQDDEQFTSFVDEEQAPAGENDSSARPVRNRSAPSWHKDFEVDYAGFALNAMSYVEDLPETVSECREKEDWPLWEQALQEEMDSLARNETWTLVKLPEGRSAITCKWVFKLKDSEDGQAPRYKARLVARGFTQKQGFDYSDTYAPVARMDTLRTVLALANHEGWNIHQMDVKTAFLNGELNEEIYMRQPEGFDQQNGLVCRLNRSLYGLKQAARSWNERFHNFVVRLGFGRSRNDMCLYRRGSGDTQVILVIYVDDVIIVSVSAKLIDTIKKSLATEFEMTDVGVVKNFLGMRIDRNMEQKTLRISQRRYLEHLLDRFQMQDCRPIATPMENRLKLPRGEESQRTSKPYRELVGCVMYVSLTSRPDLAVAANYFSQFQACPNEIHWAHLRRVLRYIQGTLDFGLVYRGDDAGPLLEAYSDADWANEITDRRSVSGAVFKVYGATVCWSAKKQATVSLSSTEAELIALCAATCHGQWLVRILEDLGSKPVAPITYHEDNQSTMKIAANPKDSGRLKHLDVKHFFVRELLESNQIRIEYIPTSKQQADILTKSLPGPAFRKFCKYLGLTNSRV